MAFIVFSHANSFPASTYRELFAALRAQGHTVHALEQFGHDAQYPVTSNWPHIVKQLAQFTHAAVQTQGEPAYLIGHSLGGFLSLMTACQYPELTSGVVLLDAPILGGWKAITLALLKRSRLIRKVSPGKVSHQRRNEWDSAEHALAHFASKKMFAQWEPRVLQDYIAHGTHKALNGKCVLNFDRKVETEFYNTLPHNLDRLLKRHPLQCKVAFIAGAASVEMQQVGMAMTRKVAGTRVQTLPGSHLFPMERPLQTAAAIATALQSLQSD